MRRALARVFVNLGKALWSLWGVAAAIPGAVGIGASFAREEPAWAVAGLIVTLFLLSLVVAVRQELTVTLDEDRRAIRQSLSRFMVEGDQVVGAADQSKKTLEDSVARVVTPNIGRSAGTMNDEWRARVRRYLLEVPELGEEYANRFDAQVDEPSPSTPPLTPEQMDFIKKLVRERQRRLREFITELK